MQKFNITLHILSTDVVSIRHSGPQIRVLLKLKIIFLISQPKHMLFWVLKRTVSMSTQNAHLK